ncbi:MAG: NAD(P)H-hydrate dehydratase [Synechococcales cyanobacterium]
MSLILDQVLVTAAEMSAIETRLLARGMPVAALMEKVAGRVAQRLQALYPRPCRVGIVAGAGHNGGDALVIGRELWAAGYSVEVYAPMGDMKDLTAAHARYLRSLGIPFVDQLSPQWQVIVDGLFGLGLSRALSESLVAVIEQMNGLGIPICSVDMPSGLNADTGEGMGACVRATHTFCLGLWKRAFAQERALDWLGQTQRVDFDIPVEDVAAEVGQPVRHRWIVPDSAVWTLPRPVVTHKYQQGHVLLIAGSRTYPGAVILAAWAARASGVGMLSIAVPESLRLWVSGHIPDAVILGCPETDTGAIAELPTHWEWGRYQAVVYGCGVTRETGDVLSALQSLTCPLLVDADGLNQLAMGDGLAWLRSRSGATIVTPHAGEFRRLFPEWVGAVDPALGAAQASGSYVVLKSARTVVAAPQGTVSILRESTPALARAGSGDVLAGLMGGLLAQPCAVGIPLEQRVQAAVWWHAQAGRRAAAERTEAGVDAQTLTNYLIPTLQAHLQRVQS